MLSTEGVGRLAKLRVNTEDASVPVPANAPQGLHEFPLRSLVQSWVDGWTG